MDTLDAAGRRILAAGGADPLECFRPETCARGLEVSDQGLQDILETLAGGDLVMLEAPAE